MPGVLAAPFVGVPFKQLEGGTVLGSGGPVYGTVSKVKMKATATASSMLGVQSHTATTKNNSNNKQQQLQATVLLPRSLHGAIGPVVKSHHCL